MPIDPWLANRYAGVDRVRTQKRTAGDAPRESRGARRRADALLRELDRDLRLKRARLFLCWAAAITTFLGAGAWTWLVLLR
jgi:hypothetical protein